MQILHHREDNVSWLLGCGGLIAVFFFIAAFALLAVLNRDREGARYPGAALTASHSNYSGLPFSYRWDDAYLVDDNFTAVYEWYSLKYDLGAESQAIGGCIYLDGTRGQRFLRRYVTVLVCTTPAGQRVFISRTTAVNR